MVNVRHLLDLAGRVALVSGAGGHLGAAMAEGLAEAGARILLNGRSVEPLECLRESLQAQGFEAEVTPFDVTDQTGVANALARIDRLDILINNAHAHRTGTVDTAGPEDFADAAELSTSGPFRLVQAARPLLRDAARAHGSGSVINIASMYAKVSPDPRLYGTEVSPNPPFYGAAKAGLLQLTRYLACHLAADGIRVNAISPGPFPNPATLASQPAFGRRLRQRVPLDRLGTPDDLKGAVVFLASDASAYVTGIDLPVDGGWTAW